MSDIVTEANRLAAYKTRLYNKLVAQGDTTIQANDSLDTYMSHYEALCKRSTATLNITENGIYTATNQEISGYANINVNVPGGETTHRRYKLYDRVYDVDNINGIGTVLTYSYDSNGTEYAVVYLDSTYMTNDSQYTQYTSKTGSITNLPMYSYSESAFPTETATFNCDKILEWCNSNNATSPAVSYCRSLSFNIGGTTYYAQLPTITQLTTLLGKEWEFMVKDPTSGWSGDYNTHNFYLYGGQFQFNVMPISSTQAGSNSYLSKGNSSGGSPIISNTKTEYSAWIYPVLEIPNVITI